ncbi:uncharacterized protein METZ01_LOCUS463755 [marine metagenome]|uniref:Uncharacterized protein n=1 Tax=marine metagenome TaxID=408172 RepID=A0A383ATF9_9ZZZZ
MNKNAETSNSKPNLFDRKLKLIKISCLKIL